jgi:phosphoglycolate phosphatase
MLKVVIIDFDDTLCLTEEVCFDLENKVVEDMGFPRMSREAHKMNWGQPLETAIVERVPGIDPVEFMRKASMVIEEYAHEGRLDSIQDKNLEALDTLIKSGRRLAILTSRTYGEAKHLLDKNHPINQRMEKIYHKDNSEFHKPDPRAFDKILADFQVTPEEAVYIGDAATDAIAAKEAGLHFIAVLESGLRTKEDFTGKKVDAFVSSFSDVVSYILNLGH